VTLFLQTGEANILTINGTFIIELIAFLLMLAFLARFAYPAIDAAAQRRQRAIAEALESAEKQRKEAQEKLEQAQEQLEDARRQAQEVISGASRSAEQIRQDLKERGEEEAKRLVESARRDIEAARQQALESVRQQVAGMVVVATEKVIGESLDEQRHRKLIDEAIKEVASGDGRG
jgi:F-type H+-transporting ATPase subunit b